MASRPHRTLNGSDNDPVEAFRLARPKPSKHNYVPTPEEWAAWCANPVSEWVAAAFAAKAAECRETWTRTSWDGAVANQELLIELRTRADNFEAFLTANFKDYLHASSKS